MPWVSGRGSILEPLDDSTKFIQKIEPTGVFKGALEITKKTVDVFTQIFTRKKLTQSVNGFQLPLAMARSLGTLVYLLYGIPIVGLLCCWFTIRGNRRRHFDLIVALIGFSLFFILYKQTQIFNQDKLFMDVHQEWGFVSTVYSFLAIGILSLVKLAINKKTRRRSFKGRR